MNNNIFIGHSKDDKAGIKEQTLYDHTINVFSRSLKYLEKSKNFITDSLLYEFIHNVLEWASIVHDMGKIDLDCQKIMRGHSAFKKMLNHVDAGTAYLLKKMKETNCDCFFWACILVNGHHRGLVNFEDIIYLSNGFLKKTLR